LAELERRAGISPDPPDNLRRCGQSVRSFFHCLARRLDVLAGTFDRVASRYDECAGDDEYGNEFAHEIHLSKPGMTAFVPMRSRKYRSATASISGERRDRHKK
jgi:hypothetical protein